MLGKAAATPMVGIAYANGFCIFRQWVILKPKVGVCIGMTVLMGKLTLMSCYFMLSCHCFTGFWLRYFIVGRSQPATVL